MSSKSCPYLGLEEDPTTLLEFPSKGNLCHRVTPIAAIDPVHQRDFCLSSSHTQCPAFIAVGNSKKLPPFLSQKGPKRLLPLSTPSIWIGSLTLFVLLSLVLLMQTRLFNGKIPSISKENGYQSQSLLDGFLIPTQEAGIPLDQKRVEPTPTQSIYCTPPPGWEKYLVQPTDSLFRLSVLVNQSIAAIQQANCLGNETVLLPGQIIFLPIIPTSTPTPSLVPAIPMITATPQAKQPAQVRPTSTPPPTSEPPKPVPTTLVPPTPISNTPIPPTEGNNKPTRAAPDNPPKQAKPTKAQPNNHPKQAKPTKPHKNKQNPGANPPGKKKNPNGKGKKNGH
jgi:hypothetical protein